MSQYFLVAVKDFRKILATAKYKQPLPKMSLTSLSYGIAGGGYVVVVVVVGFFFYFLGGVVRNALSAGCKI